MTKYTLFPTSGVQRKVELDVDVDRPVKITVQTGGAIQVMFLDYDKFVQVCGQIFALDQYSKNPSGKP